MARGIYLCAYKAEHPGHDIVYQDLIEPRDIGGDCLDTPLKQYDYVICTPPCNWWWRANYRRDASEYALKTRHLLPCMLLKLLSCGKPFIVENVRNDKKFYEYGLFNLPLHIYRIGRHTYWTNIPLSYYFRQSPEDIAHTNPKDREGGQSVHDVIEVFIQGVEDM